MVDGFIVKPIVSYFFLCTGLVAGKLLRDAGHSVILLEATDRPGGRIQTYRNQAQGWQTELGPMRIPSTHKFSLQLVKYAKLKVRKFQSDSSPFHFYIRY